MIEELRQKFLNRFLATAQERIATALNSLKDDDAAAVASEMHALAGEASMLGLVEVAESARGVEADAKEWVRGERSKKVACVRGVRTVSRLVAAVPPIDQARETSAPSGGERRVLIVDDSELTAQQIAAALGDRGLRVAIATSLEAAVDKVDSFRPDLVIADVNIPGTDTATLVSRVRERSPARLTIMLLSAMSEEELATVCSAVNADGYVSKMAGMHQMIETLFAYLDETVNARQ